MPAQEPEPIPVEDLEPPPEEIAQLLARGNISWSSGGQRLSADPASTQSGQSAELGSPVAAETRYQLAYRYRSKSSWQIRGSPRRVLLIQARFFDVQWDRSHQVWFRERPASEGFWQHPLVLHELDHVRLSADPRLERRFVEWLNQNQLIRHELSEAEVVGEALVGQLVESHVARIFGELSQLVAIRYQELDRISDHGRQPLPADSSLQRVLEAADRPEG